MRLIDADALLKKIDLIYPHYFLDVEQIINEQPTAYDVDEVVEELLDSAKIMSEEKLPHRYYKAIGTRKAIEIVKRGGIDAGTGDFIQSRD
jgi:hypothetical protein